MIDIFATTTLDDFISQARLKSGVPLPQGFYLRKTAVVARELLGKCLIRRIGGKLFAGLIVETEAYLSKGDAASHSACGETARNASMFAAGGACYVYLSYGINYCMNVVTGPAGTGEAVLIRALRPVSLAGEMLRIRSLGGPGTDSSRLPRGKIVSISNGPGKLTAALGVSLSDDRRDFFGPGLKIIDCGLNLAKGSVVSGPRIGITKDADLPLRFHIAGSPWVSRPAHTTQKKI